MRVDFCSNQKSTKKTAVINHMAYNINVAHTDALLPKVANTFSVFELSLTPRDSYCEQTFDGQIE